MIYLDNAATTLKKPPCVAEAVVRAMATMGNSGRSAHQEALDASRVIYRTREQLAKLLGCSAAERVVFTCNSTEALNIAIDGLFAPGDHVLSTDCEHNSVLRPLSELARSGVITLTLVPPDADGRMDAREIERALTALPQRDRLLFYRKYYYRQSTAQIAAELGTTERAVEGRLYRIKKALRKALGGDDA